MKIIFFNAKHICWGKRLYAWESVLGSLKIVVFYVFISIWLGIIVKSTVIMCYLYQVDTSSYSYANNNGMPWNINY